MGLLDWFMSPKSNVEEVEDFIWINAEAKRAGVIRSVTEALDSHHSPTVVLIVTHFTDCLQEMRQVLDANGIDDPRVFALQAGNLEKARSSLVALADSQSVELIVPERHPLPKQDDAIVEFARQCKCRFRITHHLSLDDPLLQVFAGDWIRSVLERLGMTEEEPITSRMVSRRIRMAQQKLSRNVIDESISESAEAWLQENVR